MDSEGFRMFDEEEVERLLDRMAEDVTATPGDDLAVVGILRRGAPLAERLADRLEAAGVTVHRGEFELKRYSDELDVLHERTRMEEPDLPFAVEGKTILLVADRRRVRRSVAGGREERDRRRRDPAVRGTGRGRRPPSRTRTR